jgi:hypothetical protein
LKRTGVVIRAGTALLAFAHLFPMQKHLTLFAVTPSIAEAWKGFGAAAAIALYVLSPRTQATILSVAWRKARSGLVALGWLLAAAHLVPVLNHLPRFFCEPHWADAWRGFGACAAAAWFIMPLEQQAWCIGHLGALLDARRARPPVAPLTAAGPQPVTTRHA